MGIYIKGIRMPKSCAECIFVHTTYMLGRHVCLARNMADIKIKTSSGVDAYCPLIEVPDPHGALIDRDALNIGEYEREDADTGTIEISIGGLLDLYHKVKDAPTVIGAEGSEDE